MPRKPRKTKPVKARKRRPAPKTERRLVPIVTRVKIVEDKRLGLTDREIGELTGLNHQTVNLVFRRAMNRSCKLCIPLNDMRCYMDDTKALGRKPVLTDKQEREIVEFVISLKENRKKTAVELINVIRLSISESRFKQAMYNYGYGRGAAGWKIYLTQEYKVNRKAFCLRYRQFD